MGKSTLFNRLIGRRRALVDKTPGVTRDRLYGEVAWAGKTFRAIDTGGLDGGSASLSKAIRAQTLAAVAEADCLVCCLDAQDGLTPLDEEIVAVARKADRPLLFAINKVDTERQLDDVRAFAKLGGACFPISAEHGRRLDDLLDAVVAIVKALPASERAELDETRLSVAVLGRPNVGKSSLVNRLAEAPRVIAHELPGTTRDTVDVALTIDGASYLLIDTAGIRRRAKTERGVETLSVVTALKAAERAQTLLVVIDAEEGMTHQDRQLIAQLVELGRPLLIAANKWDRIPKREATKRRQAMRASLGEWRDLPIVPISARTGFQCDALMPSLRALKEAARRRISTAELNRVLEAVQQRHHLPSRGPTPMRLYYAAQVAVNPPTFSIFTGRPDAIPTAYHRYLRKAFAKALGHPGVPMRLRFRAS
ncbi:MAG: ribosome biogenesis GTPase Der [Deltaproteobacteria bacterium]|nr:ribosome biogenesis GTPase Der [Deltaproteobacteria bacterium]